MKGLATQLFEKLDLPEDASNQCIDNQCTDLQLLAQKFFEPIDHLTADRLLKENKNQSDDPFFLFCYLVASYRLGHHFIEITNNEILPDPRVILRNQVDENGISENELEVVHHCLRKAFASLDANKLIIHEKSRLFLKRSWNEEEVIGRQLERLEKSEPLLTPDFARIQETIKTKTLLPEQANAILEACKRAVSFIWGGPGTGKTYTAGIFLQLFYEALSDVEKKCFRVAIVAPTGKACTNLAKSVRRFYNAVYDVKTLHSLLQINQRPVSSTKKKPSFLPYDLIIVDESSMIDSHLMVEFLSMIAKGSRLLFLGDPDQLPPVEPGEPFTSIVKQSASRELTSCMRTDLRAILELASLVKNGKSEEALSFVKEKQNGIVFRSFSSDPSLFEKAIHELLPVYLHSFFTAPFETLAPQALFDHFGRTRLLNPLKNGSCGTDMINEQLHKMMQKRFQGCSFIEPIIVTKNDYALDLNNGEIGLLHSHVPREYALFEARGPDEKSFRKMPIELLSSYEYAYALSIHKSQGSEFEKIILILPPGSEFFGRKMLYTGITRARKAIEIWSSEETLAAIISMSGNRLSSLAERLNSF